MFLLLFDLGLSLEKVEANDENGVEIIGTLRDTELINERKIDSDKIYKQTLSKCYKINSKHNCDEHAQLLVDCVRDLEHMELCKRTVNANF